MLNIDKKKALTPFAIALLFVSLLLVGTHLPLEALPQDDLLYLHGPSLTPIHMHGPPLTPIHMHANTLIDLYDPWSYGWWCEVTPNHCFNWSLTYWEDNGNDFLDRSDQIEMTNWFGNVTKWYHVDRVTMTMLLWTDYYGFDEWIYVEFKGSYIDTLQPVCTYWTEIWPVYLGVTGHPYHIFNWVDTGVGNTGYLGVCDWVYFDDWPMVPWHVEEYGTDLVLNEKIMDPIGIEWHELYPNYCNWHNLTSWTESTEDNYPGRLSPGDQIDMWNYTSEETKWYHVDRVTFTMRIVNNATGEEIYIEYKGPFDTMYDVKTIVVDSTWHEVHPVYSISFIVIGWDDNCNGVLDFCDYIELYGLDHDIYYGWWHVEELSLDIILNEKIDDPTGIIWHELYPDCCTNDYETSGWEDNGDGLLNPCDNVTLALLPTGAAEKYHVKNMTLTLNLYVVDTTGQPPFTPGETIFIEYLDAFYFGWELLYYPKTHPLYTDWEVVCPVDYFGYPLTIEWWGDNCNGILSYCDMIELWGPDGTLICHVEDVAIDITVEKYEEPPPPPPWYKKPPYPDYAPSGVPDFDQKQDAWMTGNGWTYCGPVAVAESLWWFDSKYENNTISPPAISDNYPLVTSYNTGVWDDHDPQNVMPLVQNLAFLMDTDGNRTGLWHTGTNYIDMQVGISQYLQQQGINPVGDADGDGDVDDDDIAIITAAFPSVPGMVNWNMAADVVINNAVDNADLAIAIANNGSIGRFYEKTFDFPDFFFIEEEIERCEDVVLLLTFWQNVSGDWVPVEYPFDLPSGGHYVTCAGVNSTTEELLLCDPWWDAAEAGWPGDIPAPHAYPHGVAVHNDALFVSHDAYNVAFWPGGSPYPGVPVWELSRYLQQLGYPPTFHAFIRAAVVTSPLADHDVAIINKTTSKTGCVPKPTVGEGYTANITVVVENQGGFVETFDVTAKADSNIIGTQQVNNLNPGENRTLLFVWDTTGYAYGNYTISAEAILPGDADPGDNILIDGNLKVVVPGDINGDAWVELGDFYLASTSVGYRPWDPEWNPNADLNDDTYVELGDFYIISSHVGGPYGYAP